MAGILCPVLIIVFCVNIALGDIIVETVSGKVLGVEVESIIRDEKFYSFMGIPYGQAPVNESRFKPPQPHPKWDDILDATKEKNHCPLFNLPTRRLKNYGFCGQEDCLHLSIHTPKLPSEQNPNLPVIVFLYNEQFRITHNGTKDLGPDFFMKEDVIIITISHRIGAFGFLTTEDDEIPGNNGIKDVILALKWIQTNIHKFGGNNFRITLMGNHGGAVLVDLLLHSPKAKGLFSAAILQSGTSWSSTYFNSKQKGKQRSEALAETLEILHGSSSLLLKELNRLDIQKISEAELLSVHADESREIQKLVVPFVPVVEPDHPDAILSKEPGTDPIDITIPVMIGYTTNEGIEACERLLRKPQYLTFSDRDFMILLPTRVDYYFELRSNAINQAIQDIKDFYFEEGYVKVSKPGEYIKYLTDAESFYAIDYTVRKYTNESFSPVYYYAFDYSGELNHRKKKALEDAITMDGTWGATLGDDLCYLFVCKAIKKEYVKALADPDSDEIRIIKRMVKLWADFARTGNPTPNTEDFTWLPASKENKECLVISDDFQMKTNLNQDRVNFWDEFLDKYQKLAIDGVIKDVKDEL